MYCEVKTAKYRVIYITCPLSVYIFKEHIHMYMYIHKGNVQRIFPPLTTYKERKH